MRALLFAITAICVAQVPAPKRAASTPAHNAAADIADFEKVCGACHATSLVSDIRSEIEWKETVEQMVSLGAKGSEEQLGAVMRVLERTLTKINVNTATATQLMLVLGVSEPVAQAVVKRRDARGPFKTLADLKKVPGIDAAIVDACRDRLVF